MTYNDAIRRFFDVLLREVAGHEIIYALVGAESIDDCAVNLDTPVALIEAVVDVESRLPGRSLMKVPV